MAKKKGRKCDHCDVVCETTKFRKSPHNRFLCEICKVGQDRLKADIAAGKTTPFSALNANPAVKQQYDSKNSG